LYEGAFFNTVTILNAHVFAVFWTANLTASDHYIFRLLNHPAAKLIGVISTAVHFGSSR